MNPDYGALLEVAITEARQGLAEGGIPIGAALFDGAGLLLGQGRNRRVQEGDPSVHGETDAFRKAGRQTKGVRLMNLGEGDTLIAIARNAEEDPEAEGAEPDAT